MEDKEKVLCKPDNAEVPCDAVQFKTKCIRTDFKEAPDGTVTFYQNEKSEANISASYEHGCFSIRDKASGVMLTVAFDDAVVLLAAALDAAKDAETEAPKPEE